MTPELSPRPLRPGQVAGDAQPAGRGARRGAGGLGRRPARRRDSRRHRRHLRAAQPLRRGGQSPTATTSTCCRTRTAARRRPGRARRWSSSRRSRASTPVDIDEEDLQHAAHAAVQAGEGQDRRAGPGQRRPPQDFVLDTGSEETVMSRETAQRERVRPITYTLSAGVGEVGLRGLQLARLESLEFGTLQVRNLPVLIKNPALRGIPKREGESFSPLSLGMSMMIDYQKQLLTIGRNAAADGAPTTRLPMRVSPPGDGARRAQLELPGLLRRRHRRRGHLDQRRHGQRAAAVAASGGFRCRCGARRGGTATRSCCPATTSTSTASSTATSRWWCSICAPRACCSASSSVASSATSSCRNYRVSMDLAQSELRLEKF